jgi:hypothetical protein
MGQKFMKLQFDAHPEYQLEVISLIPDLLISSMLLGKKDMPFAQKIQDE